MDAARLFCGGNALDAVDPCLESQLAITIFAFDFELRLLITAETAACDSSRAFVCHPRDSA